MDSNYLELLESNRTKQAELLQDLTHLKTLEAAYLSRLNRSLETGAKGLPPVPMTVEDYAIMLKHDVMFYPSHRPLEAGQELNVVVWGERGATGDKAKVFITGLPEKKVAEIKLIEAGI